MINVVILWFNCCLEYFFHNDRYSYPAHTYSEKALCCNFEDVCLGGCVRALMFAQAHASP